MRNKSNQHTYKALKISALASLICATQVFAGPPFLTDDPVPVGYETSEVYIFSTFDKTKNEKEIVIPAVEYNYGVLPEVQLHVVIPFIRASEDEEPTETGMGDIELGVKYRFIQESDYIPQVAIFPMVILDTGDEDKRLGNGKTWYRLPVWMQKSWGEWTSFWGGGYVLNDAPDKKDYSFGGWQVQKDINEKWTLGGEVFAKGKDSEEEQGTTILNFGGFYKLDHDLELLFSAGHSINGKSHAIGYLGLLWEFGGHEGAVESSSGKPAWSASQTGR